MKRFIAAIDQGTTSTRAILFSTSGKNIYSSQKEFKQYFPKDGWVEHNPNEIWNTTKKVLKSSIFSIFQLFKTFLNFGFELCKMVNKCPLTLASSSDAQALYATHVRFCSFFIRQNSPPDMCRSKHTQNTAIISPCNLST